MDFSKYRTFMEAGFEKTRDNSFRNWILFTIKEKETARKEEIIIALKTVYEPDYVPIMSEFNINLGKGYEFDNEFEKLMQPLLEYELISKADGKYRLTRKGTSKVNRTFRTFRHTSI